MCEESGVGCVEGRGAGGGWKGAVECEEGEGEGDGFVDGGCG